MFVTKTLVRTSIEDPMHGLNDLQTWILTLTTTHLMSESKNDLLRWNKKFQ